MQVIYSEIHRRHDPPFEILEGGQKVPVFESPARMERILAALARTGWADLRPPDEFGLEPILAVHAQDYVDYLRTAYEEWQKQGGELGDQTDTTVLLASTFPPRRGNRKPTSVAGLAGYYSFDLSCPIIAGTYAAARSAANCALTGAERLCAGESAVFALCRPPGHHAGPDYAGGYCYLNNACIAAQYLASSLSGGTEGGASSPFPGGIEGGRVALLDIDYHAANGTQDIFYNSAQVLTLSLHADPHHQYPYFTGYADEIGAGVGTGFHRNFPLPSGTDDAAYLRTLDEALSRITEFDPHYLVLSFGADTFGGDPLGDFALTTPGFAAIGARIAALGLPTLIVMEGGYNTEALGENICTLLEGFVR
ncbi:MAG: histone deacetylase family protein [Anaerolineae bacterium]